MSLGDLLKDCDSLQIKLRKDEDGEVRVNAPPGTLTPKLINELRSHKQKLFELLSAELAENHSQSDASTIWKAALGHLEGNALFPSEVMLALRTAEVRWSDWEADP